VAGKGFAAKYAGARLNGISQAAFLAGLLDCIGRHLVCQRHKPQKKEPARAGSFRKFLEAGFTRAVAAAGP
jgi:hypothetical protein